MITYGMSRFVSWHCDTVISPVFTKQGGFNALLNKCLHVTKTTLCEQTLLFWNYKYFSCLFVVVWYLDLTLLRGLFQKFCNVLAASPTATEQKDKYLSHSQGDSSLLSHVFLVLQNQQHFTVRCKGCKYDNIMFYLNTLLISCVVGFPTNLRTWCQKKSNIAKLFNFELLKVCKR